MSETMDSTKESQLTQIEQNIKKAVIEQNQLGAEKDWEERKD